MEKFTKCDQTRCAFLKFGGCRNCEICHAPPYLINETCDVCWNCKSDEGILRWGDEELKEEEEQKEKEIENQEKQKEEAPMIVNSRAKGKVRSEEE